MGGTIRSHSANELSILATDMSFKRIKAMAAAGESETLEFKSTTGARREAAATVCAMLNQRGGHVLFGVTPQGEAAGQQVSERTIEALSAELGRIDPPAFPSIERLPINEDRELVLIDVSPGPAKPYQYRGTAYRRVGNTTVAMPTEEYNRVLLERMHSDQRWENQPAGGWSVADLDEEEIRRTVDEAIRRGRLADSGTRDPVELLRGLGLYRDGVLWRAAVALFGNDPRIEFEMPQCRLRVARLRGIDRMEFLDNRQFYGNTFALLGAAERFLRETLPIAGRFEPGRMARIDEPLYPVVSGTGHTGGARQCVVSSGLRDRRWVDRCGGLRRPPGGDLARHSALRVDAGKAVRTAPVAAVESAHRPNVLPSGPDRGVGSRHVEDGRGNGVGRPPPPRDWRRWRKRDGVLPARQGGDRSGWRARVDGPGH